MKTTRVEIDDTVEFAARGFRRVVVNWHRNGLLHTVASSMLEDTAPPEKVAHVLHELAHKIERDCRGLAPLPAPSFDDATWTRFVAEVNRLNDVISSGQLPMRHDPKLPAPGPNVPVFEFFGWRVFRR